MTKTLMIDMSDGKWMVDVFSQANDSGVYDLIFPNTSTQVSLKESELYGFRYSLNAKQGTAFRILLDDIVLAEGEIDKTEMLTGNGVL
ncbi:hypothetical protein D210916BOD24_24520 [Alteromonas sp. D210916BOD_24]|uniref:hypothetical protein n=1 Tax=Alteromonas sp. D210916BOD_24 TaxID=3157618 RepID=UPI00399CE987